MRAITILLLPLLLFLGACNFFKKVPDSIKISAAEKVAKEAQKQSKKVLNCETGQAVYDDVLKEAKKVLKVEETGSELKVSKSSVGESLCVGALDLVLPQLVNFGDKKLPQSWQADKCSFYKPGESLKDLARKLCGKL